MTGADCELTGNAREIFVNAIMAFKAKKWVKPGSVVPESTVPSIATSVIPRPSITVPNPAAAQRAGQPPVSRKWVKPGLVQAAPPHISRATENDMAVGLSSEAKSAVEGAAQLQQAVSNPTQPQTSPDCAAVGISDSTPSSTSHHLSESHTPCSYTGEEQVVEGLAESAITEPLPPPPSYWKVVRAEAETKPALDGDIDPAATAGIPTQAREGEPLTSPRVHQEMCSGGRWKQTVRRACEEEDGHLSN